jgi:Flp pilus assembly protein CpaB
MLRGDPYKPNRTQWGSRLLFAFGLVLALVAGIGTYVYANTTRTGPAPEVTTVDVLVASRDLEPRSALAEGDLRIVQLPRDAAPTNALHTLADAIGQRADACDEDRDQRKRRRTHFRSPSRNAATRFDANVPGVLGQRP